MREVDAFRRREIDFQFKNDYAAPFRRADGFCCRICIFFLLFIQGSALFRPRAISFSSDILKHSSRHVMLALAPPIDDIDDTITLSACRRHLCFFAP